METKYKIVGIYYSKPRLIRGADGEAVATRVGLYINIGKPADFNGMGMKVVENIEFKDDYFHIYFKKGGLLVVPYGLDTEILYDTTNG